MQRFHRICRQNEQNPFIVEPYSKRIMTYGDLQAWTGRVAGYLSRSGVQEGDKVMLVISNQLEYTLVHFALMELGAITVTIPSSLNREQLESIVSTIKPVAWITCSDHPYRSFSPEQWITISAEDFAYDDPSWSRKDEKYRQRLIRHNDIIAILYTSGTTGTPKGVVLSYGAVMANFLEYGQAIGLNSSTRIIQPLPVEHADGWCFSVLLPFLFGACVLLTPPFNARIAATFDRLLTEHQGSVLVAVPSMLRALLEMRHRFQLTDASNLSFVLCSSAKLFHQDRLQFQTLFNTCVLEFYGSTEALLIAYDKPNAAIREGSVGRLSPQVYLRSEDDRLFVHSPFLFKGYFQEPDKTAAVFDGIWYETGDIGYVDQDGYLYLQGRQQYTINKAGQKIDPSVIEQVCRQLPGVFDAVAISKLNENREEDIYIFLVGNHFAIENQSSINTALQERLTAACWPRGLQWVDYIPLTPMGKVDRQKLIDSLAVV